MKGETVVRARTRWIGGGAALIAAVSMTGLLTNARNTTADTAGANQLTSSDPSGILRTITTAGSIDTTNPFFQDLGTNGRTCFTCHRPAEGWTITPEEIRDRFERTRGLDPIFRTNDGSNCEGADISTLARRRRAFTMLLTRGVIRVGMKVPDDAEFEIVDVDDPYGCGAPYTEASMYRRPLPSTNLGFLSTVMWDGRETVRGQAIAADLMTQAIDATTGHAQGATPSAAIVKQIVDFESGLLTAQASDEKAGVLSAAGAHGGPVALSKQPFCIGTNDPLNILPVMPGACASPSGGLDTNVFTSFAAWAHDDSPARRAIARGEQLFNSRTFVIDGVGGLNGTPADPVAGPIQNGTCTVCHDTPGAGDHSIALPLNLGLTAASRRTADQPLYTIENRTTHESIQTTDPGRAMATGKWSDIGKFKGPILRGLAARAPYFHDGSAATLADAVDFYNTRFNIGLTAREKADLVAFLKAL
jgi:cytochrome c peroxidase